MAMPAFLVQNEVAGFTAAHCHHCLARSPSYSHLADCRATTMGDLHCRASTTRARLELVIPISRGTVSVAPLLDGVLCDEVVDVYCLLLTLPDAAALRLSDRCLASLLVSVHVWSHKRNVIRNSNIGARARLAVDLHEKDSCAFAAPLEMFQGHGDVLFIRGVGDEIRGGMAARVSPPVLCRASHSVTKTTM